jgi:mannan endo-1,4-beta-mannosidase
LADTQRLGRHRQSPPERFRTPIRRHRGRLAATITAAGIAVAIVVTFAVYSSGHPAQAQHSAPQHRRHGLPTTPGSYIGLYAHGAPDSYAGVEAFMTATGVKPDVVVYYSGWLEPFQVGFATTVTNDGAVPLVQMNPTHVSIAAIAAGRYDSYLSAYAEAVRAYHHPVILSFGHEMNGYWYSWGYTHTPPVVFVAAWRHIVTLFRSLRVQNVTWLWTINAFHWQTQSSAPSPGPWWPGNSYVNWIGIDGYFTDSSSVFASVFGPTIVYVRALTHDPILIAETSATPVASQPVKIADLFAGIHLYGLLGFIWFDWVDKVDWRLSSPAAIAAFRRGANTNRGSAS